MNLVDLFALGPEIFLACAGMILLVVGAFYGARSALAINAITGISFVGAFVLLFCTGHNAPVSDILGGHVGVDAYA
ncbi:MAG: hypothetical protein HY053_00965, partial [Proteobacteria bacterium]|nr:hypothetical protein [Pseudomonadota bacterium]